METSHVVGFSVLELGYLIFKETDIISRHVCANCSSSQFRSVGPFWVVSHHYNGSDMGKPIITHCIYSLHLGIKG